MNAPRRKGRRPQVGSSARSPPRLLAAIPKNGEVDRPCSDRTKEPGRRRSALAGRGRVDARSRERRASHRGPPTDSRREFDPGMVRAGFAELAKESPKRHFRSGIRDDVTICRSSTTVTSTSTSPAACSRSSTVGADGNRRREQNSIKIIGEETDHARRLTSSSTPEVGRDHHLAPAFGRDDPFLVSGEARPSFVAATSQLPGALRRACAEAADDAVFLLNAPYRRRKSGPGAARSAGDHRHKR